MLFVNDERVELKELEKYKGDDYVLKQLSAAYNHAKELGFPLKFKCDALHRGVKEGKKGIFIPFTGEIETNTGSSYVAYAQSARSVAGGIGVDYKPRGETMRKTWVLGASDLDKILFLMVACPLVKAGQIYIEDLEAKAKQIANRRTAGSALSFYLYNEHSPLYADETRLMAIASALGISDVKPEKFGLNELKNSIFEKVEMAEKIHDGMFGYKWFSDAVNEFTPMMNALRDIQVAIDKKVIKFNEHSFRWMLVDANGEDMRILCPVEPAKTSLRKEILASHCLKDPDTYELIKGTFAKNKRQDDAIGDVFLSRQREEGGAKVDFATMEWMQMRTLASKNGILIKGKNKAEIIKELELRRETLTDI